MNLTPRQSDLMTAIAKYRHVNGFAPTMQELADKFEISKVTVFEHLGILERKGLILREKHKARSIELVDAPKETRELIGLPLIGEIGHGPIRCNLSRDTINLASMFASRDGVYALRVRGDSMIAAHIQDGDYVVIRRTDKARNGETVLALLPTGEAVIRRFYNESPTRVRLMRADPTAPGELFETYRVRIQGVAIGMIRA